MYHFLTTPATSSTLVGFRWRLDYTVAFIFAVPPAGPGVGTHVIASGSVGWSISLNYATGLVSVTRGSTTLTGSVPMDNSVHMLVWTYTQATDTTALYLDDPSTPVDVDSSAGYTTLNAGTVSIGAVGDASILIGQLRIRQYAYDPAEGAIWASPVGCRTDTCRTILNPEGATAGPMTVSFPWTAPGVPATFTWPTRAKVGSMDVAVLGGTGGTWQDITSISGGAGGSLQGRLIDSPGSVFTIRPGEGGHNCQIGIYGTGLGGPGSSDGRGGDSSGGGADGGHGYIIGAGGAGAGAGTTLLMDGVELAVAGGGGAGGAKTILTPWEYAGGGGSGIGDGGHGEGSGTSAFYGQGGRGATLTGPGPMALGPSLSTTSGTGNPGVGRMGSQGGAGQAGGGGYFGGGSGGTARGGGGGSSWADTSFFTGPVVGGAFGSFPTRANIGRDGGVAFRYNAPDVHLTGHPSAPSWYPQEYVPVPGLPSATLPIGQFEIELTASGMITAESARIAVVLPDKSANVPGTWYIPGEGSGVTVGPIGYRRIVNWTGTKRLRFVFNTFTSITSFMVIVSEPLSGSIAVGEWSIAHYCPTATNKVSVGMLLAN